MRDLSLSDLKLGLDDLFTRRAGALKPSAIAKVYLPQLEKLRADIAKLPPAVSGATPLVEELASTDREHDGYGTAIWHLTEAYLALPRVKPDVAAAATRLREILVPRLGALREPYAREAQAARENKKQFAKIKKDLDRFPVAGSATLAAWAREFVDAGARLDELLTARVDATAQGPGSSVGPLRGRTIGLLGRFRAALADELAHDDALPRDLDAKVFGYFDELQASAERRAQAAQKTQTAKKARTTGKQKQPSDPT